MMPQQGRLLWRTQPPALRATQTATLTTDKSVRRRLGFIWGLLFFDVLGFTATPAFLPVHSSVAKVLTEGALGLALLLALSLNRRILIRPNLFLGLFTILAATTLMMSVDQYFGFGSMIRAGRLVIFIAVLWLITPWWGRSDFLLCRMHWKALLVVLGSVLLGVALAPHKSFPSIGGGRRLSGAFWPIPPTQVAHYAAIFTGLTIVLWLSRAIALRWTALLVVLGVAILVLTHTRTALIGLLAGVLVAGVSLFASRKRARHAFLVAIIVAGIAALSFAPFFSHWFTRGQSTQEVAALTGRTVVWSALLAEPRSEIHILFGYGMSNDSFNGLSIDSSWLSTYLDQGLVGDLLIGSALVLLAILALISPRGPNRAIALFLVVYCAIASYTETGLGDASTYMLDLTVAMSVLMAPLASRWFAPED
jgi:hypothetical protein